MGVSLFLSLRIKRALIISFLVSVVLVYGYSESIDDLFSDPDQGIVEEEESLQPAVLDLESLVGHASTSVGGSVNIRGGMGLFLNKWFT
jgi:hypothetical protein